MRLTVEQISEMYGYSVNSIKSNFIRTATAIKKKYGVELFKCKGADGEWYMITSPRALTMYEEMKDELYVPIKSIRMDDLACFILIGVAATPQGVFRGTYKDFLDYMGLSHSKKNIDLLKEVLDNFNKMETPPVKWEVDKDMLVIYIDRQFEQKQILTITMLRECQNITKKYHKSAMKVVQLLKVWQAYRINEQKGVNPLTDKNLQEYINLSEYQIREAKKLLVSEGVIKTERVGNAKVRYGTEFDINGLLDDKKEVIKE